MSSMSGIAIGWVHFRMRGGLRMLVVTTIGYAAVIVAGIGLFLAAEAGGPGGTAQVMYGWTLGLMAIQTAVLLLYGGSRVGASIRQDLTSRMIESHRLMPVDRISAVCSYLLGVAGQCAGVVAVTFVIGLVTSVYAGRPASHWLMVHGILVPFALFVWAGMAMSAFLTRGALVWLIVLGMLVMMSEGEVLRLVPGLMVFLSPLIGRTIFELMPELDWPYAVALGAQAVVGGLFVVAAARKYSSDALPSWTPVMGLVLLGVATGASMVGILFWEQFQPLPLELGRYGGRAWEQFWVSLGVLGLVAVVPVQASARQEPRADGPVIRWRMPPVLVVAGATAVVLMLTALLPGEGIARGEVIRESVEAEGVWGVRLRVAVVLFTFLMGMNYLLRWVYMAVPGALLVSLLWVGLTVLGPLLADFARFAMWGDPYGETIMTAVSGGSPLGSLLLMSQGRVELTTVGLFVQAGWVALAAGLYYRARARGRNGVERAMLKVAA